MPDSVKDALQQTTGALHDNTVATSKAAASFGSMGLKGLFATVGNASAMVVISVMFMIQTRDIANQSKDDRIQNHADTTENRQAIVKMSDAMQSLVLEIRAWKH